MSKTRAPADNKSTAKRAGLDGSGITIVRDLPGLRTLFAARPWGAKQASVSITAQNVFRISDPFVTAKTQVHYKVAATQQGVYWYW
jgi:hypothetical protein